MSNNNGNTSSTVSISGGIFLPLLAIVLITLKLTGVIAWSWWWVLAPLWGPVALLLFVLGLLVMAAPWAKGGRK